MYTAMKRFSLHPIPLTAALVLAALFVSSCGDDRSGEQPFAPTVKSVGAETLGDSVRLTGLVTASPNSSLTQCGFAYGNDTLRLEKAAPAATTTFSVVTDSLGNGTYYAVPYARNGVGKSYGDTLRFTKG